MTADDDPDTAALRPRRRRRGVWRVAVVSLFGLAVVGACFGFFGFLALLRGSETPPTRHADGIVVLTGGSSRISDAMELLAGGYGKRLLISGVHPASGAHDISRSVPESQQLIACCVDLGRSAFNTRSNAQETRRWAHERGFRSVIVVTSNYHMPRAILEMAAAMPDVELIPFAVIGETWRDEPWWTSATAMRLLVSEYAKFVAVAARVALAQAGIDLSPEPAPEGGPRAATTAVSAK